MTVENKSSEKNNYKYFFLHTHRAVDLACPAKYVVRWEGGGGGAKNLTANILRAITNILYLLYIFAGLYPENTHGEIPF